MAGETTSRPCAIRDLAEQQFRAILSGTPLSEGTVRLCDREECVGRAAIMQSTTSPEGPGVAHGVDDLGRVTSDQCVEARELHPETLGEYLEIIERALDDPDE